MNNKTISPDSNKSVEFNTRNTESRLTKLEQIKLTNKNIKGEIDNKVLNEIFASLEKEIFWTNKLFSYEYNKAEKKYYAIYMWIKLNIPIDNPEQLIHTLNLLDRIIDVYLFKGWKPGKFEAGMKYFWSNFAVKNTDGFHMFDTSLTYDETLEKMTWNNDWPHYRNIHLTENLSQFLNEVQDRINTVNNIGDLAQYQRDIPTSQGNMIANWTKSDEKVQKEATKWRNIKIATKRTNRRKSDIASK